VKGDTLRLYSTSNVGVGGHGRTDSFVECQTSLLTDESVGLLWLLFSAEALKENGTIDRILEQSKRFAESVAKKLRERIYDIVVPALAMGIADARKLKSPDRTQLAETYEMALLVLFRLLFIAYAEDLDLLPYKLNDAYKVRSLKLRAQELSIHAQKGLLIDAGPSNYWKEAEVLFDAIAKGNKNIGVPAYNGAMFSADKKISPNGAKLNGLKLDNQYFEKALRALLLVNSEEGSDMPVDFRDLSVREFGTIYEGLLESELSLAVQPLARQSGGVYKPVAEDGKSDIQAGQIYMHNRSGVRKSTGSFYTPESIVDYLLDASLKPAIQEHLERLSAMKSDADRADNLFKFRVVDISMGSGHFLVAAIDCIQSAFAPWLAENPIPGVSRELESLRQAAMHKLADCADRIIIEDERLLRRMIARRCIYGVDINPLAVQLARLSIWIHTFVPGLP
ncbi:MAG: hypothetical protein K8963_03155, partial [Proteobacteria bacterium]|nr:hypothetical protein [Pseudomonadota bacterium]